MTTKYDDASWHSEGDFPSDLPDSAAATHIAMFAAWCVLNGLAGELHTSEFADELAALRRRETTPGEWFLAQCDGKLTNEDLSDQGNFFAETYYDPDNTGPSYMADYVRTFPGLASLYEVPDAWENFDKLAPLLRQRYEAFRKGR